MIGTIDAVMRMPSPSLGLHGYKAQDFKKWRSGIGGRPSWRMEPHIKGWETKLATDEARLRAALKPRKAKLI